MNVNTAFFFLELVYIKNICFETMAANQTDAPGLNRDLSSDFCCLKSANPVKFTEECVMRTKK